MTLTNIHIIKIGTNILATSEGKLDLNNLRSLVNQICELKQTTNQNIIIITSGAITCGSEKLGIQPQTIPQRQAAAAVGQFLIMKEYALFFESKGYSVGQILVTKDSLKNTVTAQNAKNTIETLFATNGIPIINENDCISTDEIDFRFTDNDHLSVQVAKLLNAKQLTLLTDTDGVFTKNPKYHDDATLIPEIKEVTQDILDLAQDTKNQRSRGGMNSKLNAAKEALDQGIEVRIANGRTENILTANSHLGTTIG